MILRKKSLLLLLLLYFPSFSVLFLLLLRSCSRPFRVLFLRFDLILGLLSWLYLQSVLSNLSMGSLLT